MRFFHFLYLVYLTLLSSVIAQGFSGEAALERRQDGTTNSNTGSSTASSQLTSGSQTTNTASAAASTGTSSGSTASDVSTITSTGSTKPATASSNRPLTTAKTIAQNAPAGGISMISPAAAPTTYYKVGQKITFVWNYTSLLAPPSAINILVSNTASTYTLTQNASVQATATYIWDTNQYKGQQNPLLNAFYTLGVYDAASAYTAVPSPGHLAANGLNPPFGIYATQTPSVSNVMECVTCGGVTSAAMSLLERQITMLLFAVTGFTLLALACY